MSFSQMFIDCKEEVKCYFFFTKRALWKKYNHFKSSLQIHNGLISKSSFSNKKEKTQFRNMENIWKG